MNSNWRTILRNRALASVTLHRKPAAVMMPITSLPPGRARARALVRNPGATHVLADPKPFIHMLFRPDCAEDWMTKDESDIPDGWLAARGFDDMEYFDVKVGVAPAGLDCRMYA